MKGKQRKAARDKLKTLPKQPKTLQDVLTAVAEIKTALGLS